MKGAYLAAIARGRHLLCLTLVAWLQGKISEPSEDILKQVDATRACTQIGGGVFSNPHDMILEAG